MSVLVCWVCSSMYITLLVVLPASCTLETKIITSLGGGRGGNRALFVRAQWSCHRRTRNLNCRLHTISLWVLRQSGVWGHVGGSVRVPGRGSARRRHRPQERPNVHRQAHRGERCEPKTKTIKCTGITFVFDRAARIAVYDLRGTMGVFTMAAPHSPLPPLPSFFYRLLFLSLYTRLLHFGGGGLDIVLLVW